MKNIVETEKNNDQSMKEFTEKYKLFFINSMNNRIKKKRN